MKITRKAFIKSASVGLAGAAVLSRLPSFGNDKKAYNPQEDKLNSFYEQARYIPIVDDADVIVCGGGPAGIAAALAAARTGAKVRLFEVHGCLGGVWTAGMLAWVFDFDKPGITNELTKELTLRGAR